MQKNIEKLRLLSLARGKKEYYLLLVEEGQFIGPIEKLKLKQFLQYYQLPTNTQIRKIEENNFYPLFEHPDFDRRSPPLHNEPRELKLRASQRDIYCLSEGHKIGPFNQAEIHQLLRTAKLLYTDLISTNKGLSWNHLFEFREFDRREHSHRRPHLPQDFQENNTSYRAPPKNSPQEKSTHEREEEMALANLIRLSLTHRKQMD